MTGWRLDRPCPGRPHRLYVALTNRCNRECPWCSTWSSPRRGSFLAMDTFVRLMQRAEPFEVQLEGGEPTLHPRFDELVRLARACPRCTRVVVGTNGSTVPRGREELRTWLAALGEPLTLKVSLNHHLLERDAVLLDRFVELFAELRALGGDRLLVVNGRYRPDLPAERASLESMLRERGLAQHANLIPLQRYGRGGARAAWPLPSRPWTDFTLVNPDGSLHGADLLGRSEAMRLLA